MIRATIFLFLALACSSISFAFQPGDAFKPGKLPPADVACIAEAITKSLEESLAPIAPPSHRRFRDAA